MGGLESTVPDGNKLRPLVHEFKGQVVLQLPIAPFFVRMSPK